jgi:NADPH2:quinone reductase
MRALMLSSFDGPAGLALMEQPEPDPGSGVVIDVHAAGVSFPDLLMTLGQYQSLPPLPASPGLEVAGVVRSSPPDSRARPGERVWASLDFGGFAEAVAAPSERVFPLPAELDFVEGAALPVNYLTAVFAVTRRTIIREGEDVVVLGAAGGLGSALVGVTRALGARVIAAVSVEAKRDTAIAAGAHDVVVGLDWRQQVLALTGGKGVDLVADPVGGDATTEAVRATAPEGRVLILGFASGAIPAVTGNRLLLRNVSLVGAGLGALLPFAPNVLSDSAGQLRTLVSGGLRPLIGATLPLEDGAEALRRLADREAQGKIVLTMSTPTPPKGASP